MTRFSRGAVSMPALALMTLALMSFAAPASALTELGVLELHVASGGLVTDPDTGESILLEGGAASIDSATGDFSFLSGAAAGYVYEIDLVDPVPGDLWFAFNGVGQFVVASAQTIDVFPGPVVAGGGALNGAGFDNVSVLYVAEVSDGGGLDMTFTAFADPLGDVLGSGGGPASVVPEPSSALVFAVGSIVIGRSIRRRRRN